MSSSGWFNFWEDQREAFNEVMKISTSYFALQLEELYHVKPGDSILDYGCGPGFLSDYFSTKNISVAGADINKYFLEQSKKNHHTSLFIHITTDLHENRKLFQHALKNKKFDFIILLSITQYFDRAESVKDLIEMLLLYLKENGKIIVADVVVENSSSTKDAISLFGHCLKKGRIGAFLRFILYLLFSNYRKLSSQLKLLRLSDDAMNRIAGALVLNCDRVNGLTIHSSRTSYVLSRT